MIDNLLVYLPMDRRLAMARGVTLPDRTTGSALFADISGFTPLTEALVRELGPQRGAEELTGYLNQVYDALIDELHHWGGSAISFAGDAVTCWFDGDDGTRAAACALSMQEAMNAFSAVETPAGSTVELSMKAAVAVGSARRFLVGDPQSRVIDALAGSTLERLAAAEHEANRGEVVLAPCALVALQGQVEVAELRQAEDGRQFGMISTLLARPELPPAPQVDLSSLDEEQLRPWLLPPVYRRLSRGLGNFLAEIRPTVAVFMRFSGIDYDVDDDTGEKLDATVRAVQGIVDSYQGTLIDLNIGDKGSYLYINFGAPLAHENNAVRAASAALELRSLPEQLQFLEPVQIGISGGRMRAGAYGGAGHRTYGVLGDAVNLSARLMMASEPGSVLVSKDVEGETADLFEWEMKDAIRVKGKSEPVGVSLLKAVRPRIGMHLPNNDAGEPLVGRDKEIEQLEEIIANARDGRGQVVSFVGEAGLGKSRLVAQTLAMAQERGAAVFGGEAESHGVNSSYLVWHPIWRGLFGLDATASKEAQTRVLRRRVAEIDPSMVQRLPLLGPALQLAIPDNDLTAGLDAKLRKTLLETMLVQSLGTLAGDGFMVLVLEDCHWLDALSRELLEQVARSIEDLPVMVLLTFRAIDEDDTHLKTIGALPYYTRLELSPLTQEDLAQLAKHRLRHLADDGQDQETTDLLARRIAQQADGNPFYLEELVNYVSSQAGRVLDPNELSNLALPTSLQGLVLSRLDQLAERPKTLLQVACVVGRVFHTSWLAGIYPELGAEEEITGDLQVLSQQQFTASDPAEGEDSYYFRNIITRGVIYDSLLHSVRTALHEQTGQFLETAYAEMTDQYLDLLAYHYDHGLSENKKRYYLRRAGEFAQKSYANQSAIDYFRKVLPLISPEEQIEIMLKTGEVEKLIGDWNDALKMFQEALSLARSINDQSAVGWSQVAIGEMMRMQGNYVKAMTWLERARFVFERNSNKEGMAQVLHFSGIVAAYKGENEEAEALFEESLTYRRELDDQSGIATLLSNLAIMAEYQNDLDLARRRTEEALAIRRELGDKRSIAISLGNLGHFLRQQGELAEARTRLEEAVSLQREIGDRWYLANALNNLGNVVRAEGSFAEASELYSESLKIYSELGDGWATAYLLEDIARLIHLDGLNSDALVLLSAAGVLRESIDAPLPPADQEALDALQNSIQVELGPLYKECVDAGKHMSMDDAVAFGLSSVASREGIFRGAAADHGATE